MDTTLPSSPPPADAGLSGGTPGSAPDESFNRALLGAQPTSPRFSASGGVPSGGGSGQAAIVTNSAGIDVVVAPPAGLSTVTAGEAAALADKVGAPLSTALTAAVNDGAGGGAPAAGNAPGNAVALLSQQMAMLPNGSVSPPITVLPVLDAGAGKTVVTMKAMALAASPASSATGAEGGGGAAPAAGLVAAPDADTAKTAAKIAASVADAAVGKQAADGQNQAKLDNQWADAFRTTYNQLIQVLAPSFGVGLNPGNPYRGSPAGAAPAGGFGIGTGFGGSAAPTLPNPCIGGGGVEASPSGNPSADLPDQPSLPDPSLADPAGVHDGSAIGAPGMAGLGARPQHPTHHAHPHGDARYGLGAGAGQAGMGFAPRTASSDSATSDATLNGTLPTSVVLADADVPDGNVYDAVASDPTSVATLLLKQQIVAEAQEHVKQQASQYAQAQSAAAAAAAAAAERAYLLQQSIQQINLSGAANIVDLLMETTTVQFINTSANGNNDGASRRTQSEGIRTFFRLESIAGQALPGLPGKPDAGPSLNAEPPRSGRADPA